MNEDEAVAALEAMNGADPEEEHADADEIVAAFAPQRVREAYEKVGKWYA